MLVKSVVKNYQFEIKSCFLTRVKSFSKVSRDKKILLIPTTYFKILCVDIPP